MKRTLLLFTLLALMSSNELVAQTNEAPKKGVAATQASTENITSLKPEDGKPFVFSSQDGLDNSVPLKIEAIKEQIRSGKLSEARIKELREQMWRLENAYVPGK